MAQHVLSTFNPAPPTVTVLKTMTSRVEDYVAALEDVMLAALYLILLLKPFMVAIKALKAWQLQGGVHILSSYLPIPSVKHESSPSRSFD